MQFYPVGETVSSIAEDGTARTGKVVCYGHGDGATNMVVLPCDGGYSYVLRSAGRAQVEEAKPTLVESDAKSQGSADLKRAA